MNVKVLIDNIVRQTTVLIGQLATAAGIRAPLAHIANEVFLNLVHELEAQGVNRKVAADMFGMALRSYQHKVRRLAESETARDESLWEAVLSFVREEGPVSRGAVLVRFCDDDERVVTGILGDQVDSGLLYTSGRGSSAVYRVASEGELEAMLDFASSDAFDAMVWMGVYRLGPLDAAALAEGLGLPRTGVDGALARLISDQRVRSELVDGAEHFVADSYVVPVGAPAGWEAAVFDHYQALVRTISQRLAGGRTQTLPDDVVGASTYSFDIWPGHPYEKRVLGLLRELRRELSALRVDVTEFDESNPYPADDKTRVMLYLGQSVTSVGDLPAGDEEDGT